MRFFFAAALAWATVCLPACVAPAPDADYSPLWRSATHAASGEAEVEIAVPFYVRRASPQFTGWAVYPLCSYRYDRGSEFEEFDFLAPFGRYYRHGGRSHHRFWPLFFHSRVTGPGGVEIDWKLLPFFYGGCSTGGENYFAFLPVAGTIRDFLAFDSFSFILWPVYQKVVKKISPQEHRTSTSILLLIGWSEGGRIGGSYHILPFYMKSIWHGKYRKFSVLWPFFHYQEKNLDTDHPATVHAFWPLLHIENADNYHRYGFIGPVLFLGPLLQFTREVPDAWNGRPNTERRSYYLYDVPWPLVRVARTREYERVRIFPFYASYHEEVHGATFDSKSYLTPIIWQRNTETPVLTKSEFYFVPLYTRIRRAYKDRPGEDSYVHVWPFFYSDVNADGAAVFSTLSLLPFRRTELFEPVDRLFRPFWNLYRYERDPLGAERHKMLFNLISIYRSDTERRFSLPLLYNFRSAAGSGWQHNFLWKLVSIGGDEGGLKSLEVLFIPIIDTARSIPGAGGAGQSGS